jgi:hypothetical protein
MGRVIEDATLGRDEWTPAAAGDLFVRLCGVIHEMKRSF